MALALLAERFARLHGRRHRAIIIDHGLRPDSAQEAAAAAAALIGRGIAAEIQTLTAAPPRSGLQAWARAERYDLLCAAALADNAVLLTGHHADDQLETVSMRLQRGSGLGGLAGIRPLSLRQGVAVLRPLLAVSHDHLVAVCRHEDVAFATDPSNSDRRFERVRVRQELAAMRAQALAVPDQLARLSRSAAAMDDRLQAALAAAGVLPRIHAAGYADGLTAILDWPDATRHRVLSWLISLIGGGRTPVGMAATAQLVDRLACGRHSTVGGCRFVQHRGNWLTVAEPGRLPPVRQIARGEVVVFAGRWQIRSPREGVVRHLGVAGSGAAGAWLSAAGWCALASPVRRALPVIETLDGDLLYPHLVSDGHMPERPAEPWAEFLPSRIRLLSGE